MKNRVVCTGYGLITPFGKGDAVVRQNVFEGRHGFKEITGFDTSRSFCKHGGQAKVDQRNYRAFIRYCTEAALAMAGLDPTLHASLLNHTAVAVGNLGEGQVFDQYYRQFYGPQAAASGSQLVDTHFHCNGDLIDINDRNPFSHADAVAAMINATTIPVAYSNACIASANAIGYGTDQIRHGRCECALVGGVNVLHPLVFYNFDSSRAMADDLVRPFSRQRSGLLIGDGAAMLVLENAASCLERGITPLAEIAGWGLSSDGFHVSQPTPDGRGLAHAMQLALKKARLQPQEVDYINAHGTGTPLNDRSETNAIKRVFGDPTDTPPVSSTKSTTGHMLEATGAVEAVFSLLALSDQRIPPTANYLGPDDGLDLDYVIEGPRQQHLEVVMSNSSAFGGNNCSIIFRRWVP